MASAGFPSFSIVKRSIVANFLGRGWSSLLSLALVPVYLNFLGIESYALVGLYTTLAMLLNILDLGLSATMTREMALYSVQPDKSQEARDLVRTLEFGYWGIGLLFGGLVAACSSLIAWHWVNPNNLSSDTIQQAVVIMGATLAVQWPLSFYAGGLMGLQRQLALNVINAGAATARGLVTILVLAFVSPTIKAFFLCQATLSGLQTMITVWYLWRSLPGTGQKPKLRPSLLVNIWRFAAGISGASILIVALSQIDKVVLSKTLTLEAFGYYVLAATVAGAMSIPVAPIVEALFPRLSQLVLQKKEDELRALYHSGCQFAAFLLCPAAALLILFPQQAIWLWTGNLSVATNVHAIISLLVLGATLNCLVMSPLDLLQMAYGWLKPLFYTRLIALILAGPLMILWSRKVGALGAAIAWLIIYGGYSVITPYFVFRRLLPGAKRDWYLFDIVFPLGAALLTAFVWKSFVPLPQNRLGFAFYLTAAFLATSGVVGLSMKRTRQTIVHLVRLLRASRSQTTFDDITVRPSGTWRRWAWHILKVLYTAIPLKKQLFSGVRRIWIPPARIYRHLHFKGPFVINTASTRFSVKHHGFDVETAIFWTGLTGDWEGVSLATWITLCRTARVVIDVGANTGIYSLVAKAVNPTCRVFSFEPVPRVFDKLVENCALNGFDIDCLQAAVSNYDGTGSIYDLATEHIYSVTLNENLHPTNLPAMKVEVATRRLDSLIKSEGLGVVDLIKLDVESHEPQALEGLGSYLQVMRPTLLVEIWNNEVGRHVEALVRDADYLFFATDEHSPFRRQSHITNEEPKKGYLNYLLCPPHVAAALELEGAEP